MIVNTFMLRLTSVVILALSCSPIASAQQSEVVKVVIAQCKPMDIERIKTFSMQMTVDDQNLLIEFDGGETYLLTDEAFNIINHGAKTYSVLGYRELETKFYELVRQYAKSMEEQNIPQSTVLKLTEETDTIDGFKVRKVIVSDGARNIELAIWVCSELAPAGMRAFGERLKAARPQDYWEKAFRGLGLIEIMVLYGIPLRMAVNDKPACKAQILKVDNANSAFQLPTDYKRVEK